MLRPVSEVFWSEWIKLSAFRLFSLYNKKKGRLTSTDTLSATVLCVCYSHLLKGVFIFTGDKTQLSLRQSNRRRYVIFFVLYEDSNFLIIDQISVKTWHERTPACTGQLQLHYTSLSLSQNQCRYYLSIFCCIYCIFYVLLFISSTVLEEATKHFTAQCRDTLNMRQINLIIQNVRRKDK